MKDTVAAERYARALFLALSDKKSVPWEEVYNQLAQLNKTLASKNDPRLLLQNPLVPVKSKQMILRQQIGSMAQECYPIVLNFIDLILAKKRINLLSLILEKFGLIIEESKNVVKAYVKSAAKLDEQTKK